MNAPATTMPSAPAPAASDLVTVIVTRPAARGIGYARGASWAVRVLCWALILVLSALIAVMVAIPLAAGATPYTVLTGSMTPTYPPGTLVVVKPATEAELGVGTAITYQLDSGEPTVVTHRIVGVKSMQDGTIEYITKGDANPTNDPEPVKAVQIKGRVWYSVPLVGRLHTALTQGQHQALIVIAAGGLFAYSLTMAVGALRDRNRRNPS